MSERLTIDVDGVSLNCCAAGPSEAPPMLFVHGVTGRWQTWLPFMTPYAGSWRTYALDFRGHGSSGHPGSYRAMDYANDVVGFLKQRAEQPAVIVGHSLGAIVAIAVADLAPSAVRAIVLEDPPLGAFRGRRVMGQRAELPRFTAMRDMVLQNLPPERLFAALRELNPQAPPAALGERVDCLSTLDAEVLTTIVEDRADAGYDLEARLKRIACPTLLMQADPEFGAAVNDDEVAWASGLLRNCTLEKVPRVGHGIHVETPFEFNRMVREFLTTL